MSYEQITVEDRGIVRVVTLNRPEKLNAWTPTMQRELFDAFTVGNDDVCDRCVRRDRRRPRVLRRRRRVGGVRRQVDGEQSDSGNERPGDWVALMRASKPVVGAINGASIGVGLSMTLSMDFLVAHPAAKLSARFVKMGVVPELASSHFLVQRCGWGNASDLVLSGRTVLGVEAAALGLVDEVADDVVGVALGASRELCGERSAVVALRQAVVDRERHRIRSRASCSAANSLHSNSRTRRPSIVKRSPRSSKTRSEVPLSGSCRPAAGGLRIVISRWHSRLPVANPGSDA